MRVAYSFMADEVLHRGDGSYDFRGVAAHGLAPTLPTEIDVTLVLVVECAPEEHSRELIFMVHVWQGEPEQRDRREAARVPSRYRVCPVQPSGQPALHYLPVELHFTALRAGTYQVDVDHGDAVWYTTAYRVDLRA